MSDQLLDTGEMKSPDINNKVSMDLPVVNPYIGCFANTRVKLLDLLT